MEIPHEEGARRGAFFDLEKTLTPHAVEQVAALALWRKGELTTAQILRVAWIYLRYDLGLIGDFDTMKRSGAPTFAGRDPQHDAAIYRAFFESDLRAAIYPEARAALAACRASGVEVWIVSATYAFMVEPYAEVLGVDGWFGVRLEEAEGRCTGRITGTIWGQEGKAQAVREVAERKGLDLARCWAFGDSLNDLAMLEAVGRPVCVNPAKGLRRIAEEKGWTILKWGS